MCRSHRSDTYPRVREIVPSLALRGGWSLALQSSVRFSLRVDEVARGSYFDTFAERGSQCKVCRGCAVSVMADESASSGGSDGVSTSCATFATSIPTQG